MFPVACADVVKQYLQQPDARHGALPCCCCCPMRPAGLRCRLGAVQHQAAHRAALVPYTILVGGRLSALHSLQYIAADAPVPPVQGL